MNVILILGVFILLMSSNCQIDSSQPPNCQTDLSKPTNAIEMINLSGTPEDIGIIWGKMNKEIIIRDMDVNYLQKADAAGISKEMLIERSAVYVSIVEQIAPHWLEESRAIAREVGVDEDLYIAYVNGHVRQRFMHECTSYAISRGHAVNNAIFFHKTRDNVDKPQSVPLVESSLEGIYKFISVSDATNISCSMMVNEKGLAAACDYPANLQKESSTLFLEDAEPRYRGIMAGAIMRYIAEKASTSLEALSIIEDFVGKGYYAGGKVNGNHWLIVDRDGIILEVSNNSEHVVSKVHSQKVYFSRLNESPAAKRLREAEKVDFQLFHNVSRDKSICFDSSISGMTVEIDPDYPELLTCVWISLPVRSVAFPVFMGQSRIPLGLLDGSIYELGKNSSQPIEKWENTEKHIYDDKESLKKDLEKSLNEGNPYSTHIEILEKWSQVQAQKLVEALR